MDKKRKEKIDNLNCYQIYKPKDPNLRGGFGVRVKRIKKKEDSIVFMCGGLEFTERIDDFFKQYKV